MSANNPVFFDPRGRRGPFVIKAVLVAALVACVLVSVFVASVFGVPRMQTEAAAGRNRSFFRTIGNKAEERRAALAAAEARRKVLAAADRIRRMSGQPVANLLPKGQQVVAAFYATWEETGLHSLRANAGKITHLMPEWLHLTASGVALNYNDFDVTLTRHNKDVLQIAHQHGLRIVPILNNGWRGSFEPKRVHQLLINRVAMANLAQEIRDWLVANGFQGINVDFEELADQDYARMPRFLAILANVLHPVGLTVTADIEAGNDSIPIAKMAVPCDWIVLMAYDEHADGNHAGPVASVPWTSQILSDVLKTVPPSKIVLGVGNYGYDWEQGSVNPTSISFQDAIELAKEFRDADPPPQVMDFDDASMNPDFDYEDDGGVHHRVWFLDATSAYDQCLIGSGYGLRGRALWALGMEDPSVWNFFDRQVTSPISEVKSLSTVEFPYQVDFTGRGEVLKVVSLPKSGSRKLEIDDDSGMITDCEYEAYPSSYVIHQSGYKPKELALTFDDGPDRTYTPQILDALKELHAPATFFVIGKNAELFPDLVRREVAEGHEVGSHTFTHPNMGAVPPERAVLELNATQRAIEAITGRSTLLFRPPYNADARPSSAEEVKPVQLATQMGYLTIAEIIDPQDWLLEDKGPNGETVNRTADDFVKVVEAGAEAGDGNVILLHDAGGDRSQTVLALKRLVPELRARGFKFVSVSELVGEPRSVLMPRLSARDRALVGVDRFVFDFLFGADAILAVVFVAAIGLGLVRIGLMAPLAAFHEYGRRRETLPPYEGPVAVLIAAFNERRVIVNTMKSVLASAKAPAEVIVIDDGSTDGTGDVLREAFSGDPRVRVESQPNSGKATALNRAFDLCACEVAVCVDADTQLDPDAIGALARHFANPKVAAVAGNVRVGNVVNMLTRWQWIEYVTSQNLDRRAYSLLNTVTVVPGAIGAWRKRAVLDAGGYDTDTLAEDMDLTWRLRESGAILDTESGAIAYTEAPDTVRGFLKQRFRWSFGTLQCLWKHRGSLGRFGFFGSLALPSIWVFQILLQVLAPLIDMQILVSAVGFVSAAQEHIFHPSEYDPFATALASLEQVLVLYALFFVVDVAAAFLAFKLDRQRPRGLLSLLWQRFVYRQMMYAVIYRSILVAVRGLKHGWGKVERKASVSTPSAR